MLTVHNPLDQTEKAEGLSDAYSLIHTRSLINLAENQGFKLSSVKYQRGKNSAHSLHVARLDMPAFQGLSTKEEKPQIIIQNAHNGTSSIRIMAGVFRLVCSNGLIAGTSFLNVRLRHVGLLQSEVEEKLTIAAQATGQLVGQVEAFKSKELNENQLRDFIRQSLTLRANIAGLSQEETERLINSLYNAALANRTRRYADQGTDLWRVFNRVQEAITRVGGFQYLGDDRNYHHLRGVNQIQANTKINQELWQLAESFAA